MARSRGGYFDGAKGPCGTGCRALTTLAVAALACTAQAANLSEIYAQAVANDPQLAAARANTAARQEAVAVSRSALLPRVAASAGASKTTVRVDGTDLNPGSANFGQPFPERDSRTN